MFYFYVYEFCLHVYAPRACLAPVEVEMGDREPLCSAESWTWVLYKSNKYA